MMAAAEDEVRQLYAEFGQRKPMGQSAQNHRLPHFFLHRTFLGEQDLLIIFNTMRCRYQCHYCVLPDKSSRVFVPGIDVLAQFMHVIRELKHSLSVLDRLTLSNEGSVLDHETFPTDTLLAIARCSRELRRVRSIVLETRLEFVDPKVIHAVQEINQRAEVNILTGFETVDVSIRDRVLHKRESLDTFLQGLDRVSAAGVSLTAYVLYKPAPTMSDADATEEAEASIDFLARECGLRDIPLTIRLNPMYAAHGSKWARIARESVEYLPPRLSDVLALAQRKADEGIEVYLGLSTEGLNELWGSYVTREDFSEDLIKQAIIWNAQSHARVRSRRHTGSLIT